MERPFSVATWNVNGIRARQQQFADWVARDLPDVVCLQEIKASPAQVPEPLLHLEGYACYWHGAGGYSGVALHVRKERFAEPPVFSHPAFDHETRIVEARVGGMAIASVYVPNGGKDFGAKVAFLGALRPYVAALHAGGTPLVLVGDLNVTRGDMDVHPKERKPGVIGQRPDERELLEAILGEGLDDVARRLHPDDDQLFTWWAPWRNMRQRNIGWRIDYVLATRALADRAIECRVLADVGTSDHAPVLARFG